MSFLKSLSAQERDSLLESIVYVDKPRKFTGEGYQNVNIQNFKNILNYSQIYPFLGTRIGLQPNPGRTSALAHRLPSLSILRTGDCIQFGEYRGCGSFYVVWLKKGLITHGADLLNQFKESLIEWTGDLDDEEDNERKGKRARKEGEVQPLKLIPRNEDGPHKDGEHDCYFLSHPDEYGYSPSAAFGSVPLDYFYNCWLEGESFFFDPLLTHSQSYFGKIITTAKATDQWKDNADFPLDYFGIEDENYDDIDDNGIAWCTVANDEEEMMVDLPAGYFADMRKLFNDHFKPADWESVDGGGEDEGHEEE